MDNLFEEYSNNQYPFGGLMPFFPTFIGTVQTVGKKLRDRMYRTVKPTGYSQEQVVNFAKGTPRVYYGNPNTEALFGKYTGQDSIVADYTQAPDYLTGGRYLTDTEKEKLGVDSEATLKKYAVSDLIVPSKSKEGAFEFAYPNRLGSVPHLPSNANKVSEDSWLHSHELGDFHQIKGKDDNGTYVIYKDRWDINPFRGRSSEDDPTWKGIIQAGKKVGLDKIGDLVPWGKPFEIHGKQYYDKEGYPQKADGGYLQPKNAWDALSMREKAAMIKVAVQNGIFNLQEIRNKYNEYAEGGDKGEAVEDNTDSQYINTMEKVADENYKKWGYSNPDEALLHALNDNTYNYRGYYGKYPQSKANADTHWTDEFKTVYHPTFSNESIYSGKKSEFNPYGLTGGFWSGDTFVPMAWQIDANEYKHGGNIYIKPSHRGRLTELKKRTGKTEAELYRTGDPSVRKMITFARNSRKWHADGGPLVNLFDGESQPTQKMQIGLDVQGWPDYTTEQIVAYGDENERRRKAIQDAYLNFVTESNDATTVANGRLQNQHLIDKAVQGAKANAAWEKEHPTLNTWGNVLSAVPFAVAAAPAGAMGLAGVSALGDAAAATSAGQAITAGLAPLATTASTSVAGTPLYTWADVGLSSLFGGHGVQTAIDEGGISPTTALELLPVTRVVKPSFNETAMAIENYRYPIGRPQVPENFLTVKPQVRTRVGDVEIDNPNLLYHLDRGDEAGAFSTQGAYVEDGFLFPGTPKDASDTPYSWWNKGKPYATAVNGQPMTRLMTTTEDTPEMLHVRSQNYPIGQWNGKRGLVLNSEYVNPEGVDVSKSTYTLDPNYGWRRVFAEEAPAAEWPRANNSYLDGKQEIGMYFSDGKTFDSKAFAKDLGTGIADARLFLGSDIKAATDAYNTELAKRIGYPMFTPYKESQKRASVYVKPQITADRSTLAGSVEKNINNPALDKMTINVFYDADKGGFHETLHRGNYGEEGFSFNPKTMDFMDYHNIQEDTRNFYNFKTNKLLVPRTEDNAEWYDYMSRSVESATNSMELGRRMGLKPGAVWPGRKKAMEIFEKFAASDDPKIKAFNVLNWKQKPRRVWDAITGRYFVLGTGTVSSASLLND